MKKTISLLLALTLALSAFIAAVPVSAAETRAAISFDTSEALYVHAVAGSDDVEAWQAWQCEHDESFNTVNSSVKYFFLPSSADGEKVEIYNAYQSAVTVCGTSIAPSTAEEVSYSLGTDYTVSAPDGTFTLKFMKSTAEAAIYINNSNADGNGTELMTYLNQDKSRSAKATGAIVGSDGTVNNTAVKKIKGRGNSTWGKAKKPYNVTYDKAVSIDGMTECKKFSLLANYQDDSLSRNRFLFDLADEAGIPYASESRYVDFYSDGYYWGSYQITQKVDVGKSALVDDIDDTAYLNADGTINEDFPFLCEVDASANEDDYTVWTDSGNAVTIKAPELSEGDVGYDEVKEYVRAKFDEFFDATASSTTDLSQYCDIDSVTKLYLVNELGKNWDSGVSSLFFVYKQDENGDYKFYGSPLWDYDNSLGNATGVGTDLQRMGVDDYEEYSGWWCKYKGAGTRRKASTNIMNNLANNSTILEAAPTVWFEDFMPAIEKFKNGGADDYYGKIKGSAEMNYQSGWLLTTSGWICDHSTLTNADFDLASGTYTVNSSADYYNGDFEGMFNYCRDWLTSRAAWLSNEMYADYEPSYILGDVNEDGEVNVRDATLVQRYAVEDVSLTVSQKLAADLNNDGEINVKDATEIQIIVVNS